VAHGPNNVFEIFTKRLGLGQPSYGAPDPDPDPDPGPCRGKEPLVRGLEGARSPSREGAETISPQSDLSKKILVHVSRRHDGAPWRFMPVGAELNPKYLSMDRYVLGVSFDGSLGSPKSAVTRSLVPLPCPTA
jgi:hypothetical protein